MNTLKKKEIESGFLAHPSTCFQCLKLKVFVVLLALFLSPFYVFAQDGDEESALEKIEEHAQTLKDLIEKYQKAEIDIIKKEIFTIVDTEGNPRNCNVAIFYNNGNQARFATKGGRFEGNFDHGKELPTRPYSIRLSDCPCRVLSTTHSSSLEEINEVVEKIKKVVEDKIEGKVQDKAKEFAEKGVEKVFEKLGYGTAAGGFLSGFGYGVALGQPVGDYITESINQILDTFRERNLEAAEHNDFAPLYPNTGHVKSRSFLGNWFGSSPQMTNTWNVVTHCGTRDIPSSSALWHQVKDPIRTPPPPKTYTPDTTQEEKRLAEERERAQQRAEREEQQRWEQEKRQREIEAQRRQDEARQKYEEEQRRIQQQAREIMRTCPICDPVRQNLEAVTKRITETEQKIPDLENAVTDTEKEVENADKKAEQARNKLRDFRNPEAWVESNGSRVTTTDLEVQKEMARENWRRYMNDEQNAEETMENWENQRDPQRHEEAKERAEERLEKAVEDAEEAASQAKENLDRANTNLGDARQLLNQLNNRKNELNDLLEECLNKCRTNAEEIARGEITTYDQLLDIEPLAAPESSENPDEPKPTQETTPEEASEFQLTSPPETDGDPVQNYHIDEFPSSGLRFNPPTLGVKLDWATRSSFKDAVCTQDGLSDCTVDAVTPVLVLFGETKVFDWDLTDNGLGVLPISLGASFSLSQVDFKQSFDYGAASSMPYNIKGKTGILGFDVYGKAARTFSPVQSLPGAPELTPFFNLGISNLWNCGDFEFTSDDESYDYHRKHHGVHFKGGAGLDMKFGETWGTRFNLDYTAGGADANFRFGLGFTYSF